MSMFDDKRGFIIGQSVLITDGYRKNAIGKIISFISGYYMTIGCNIEMTDGEILAKEFDYFKSNIKND